MEPIRLEFSWTNEDFVEANQLYLKNDSTTRIRRIAYFSLIFALIYGRELYDNGWHFNREILLGMGFSCLGLLLLMGVLSWLHKRTMIKTFAKDDLLNRPIAYTMTPTSLETASPDSQSTIKWNHFTRWLESENLLVGLRGRMMHIFPKRSLTPANQTLLRQLLTEKVGPKGVIRKSPISS